MKIILQFMENKVSSKIMIENPTILVDPPEALHSRENMVYVNKDFAVLSDLLVSGLPAELY